MKSEKVILFILFLILGVIIFFILNFITHATSLILIFLIVLYAILLFFIVRKYSLAKLILIILLFAIHILILTVNFPQCYHADKFAEVQECNCVGIEKYPFNTYDQYWSECIGKATNFERYNNTLEGLKIRDLKRKMAEKNLNIAFLPVRINASKDDFSSFYLGLRNTENETLNFTLNSKALGYQEINKSATSNLPEEIPQFIFDQNFTLDPGKMGVYNVEVITYSEKGKYLYELEVINLEDSDIYFNKKIIVEVN